MASSSPGRPTTRTTLPAITPSTSKFSGPTPRSGRGDGEARSTTYVPDDTTAKRRRGRPASERPGDDGGDKEIRPRVSRGAKTRERIVLAAAEAFANGGYNGVNLNDVVVGLGLTKGALYYFFPSKEALVEEIVRRHFALMAPVAGDVVATVDNRLDAVVEMTYRVGELFQHNPITRAGGRLMNERNMINAELPRPFVGWVERITNMLTEAKARGEIRGEIDPKAMSELIVSYFFGAQTLSNEFHQRCDLRVRLDHFWALVAPALRPT